MNSSEVTQSMIPYLDKPVFLAGLLVFVFMIIILLLHNKISHAWLNFKTRYLLNRLGVKQLSNVQWPDGLGHYFMIDRLIMRHDGITLLGYKQYPGKIFCADNIDDWTQMVDQKSFRFENPLYELDYQLKIISSAIPGVPVNGYLFFDYQAEFPKGHPERVIYLNSIPQELMPDKKLKVKTAVKSAWEKMLGIAQAGKNKN